MKLQLITEFQEITIIGYNPDEDNPEYGYSMAEKCHGIANTSEIRVSRNKELTLVALMGDEPVGAVWTAFEPDREISELEGKDIYRYDFDVAVSPSARALGMSSAKVGPQLIDAALEHYRSLKFDTDGAYIRVWVVNPKLAKYLETKYGFETEGREWSPSSPHMVYYK